MTEIGVVFTSLYNDDPTNSVGYLIEHLEARAVDQMGKIVNMGEPGELQIRGFSVITEYYQDETKTKETIVNGGWFRTG